MSINDGMPAFPGTEANGLNNGCPGLTIRDYFAAKAFPYQLTMEMRPYEDYNYLNAAKRAYRMADAMLKAREP